MNYKSDKNISILQELILTGESSYNIGVLSEIENVRFFVKKEKTSYEILENSNYTFVEGVLTITNLEIVKNYRYLQVCRVESLTVETYNTDIPNLVILKDFYNNLAENFQKLAELFRTSTVKSDDLNNELFLPVLERGEIWVKGEKGFERKIFEDIEGSIKEIVEAYSKDLTEEMKLNLETYLSNIARLIVENMKLDSEGAITNTVSNVTRAGADTTTLATEIISAKANELFAELASKLMKYKDELLVEENQVVELANESLLRIQEYADSILAGGAPSLKLKYDDATIKEGSKLVFLADGIERKALQLPAGGGGGGTGSTLMKLVKVNDPVNAIFGSNLSLQINFESTFPASGAPTGNGSLGLTVNGKKVFSQGIGQGVTSVEVGKYCSKGGNTIKISVQDEYGTYRELTYSIEFLEIKVDVVLDNSILYEDAIPIRYTPFGNNVEKKIFFSLDGILIHTETTSVHNRELQLSLPKQSNGVHKLTVTAEATINDVASSTAQKSFEFMCSSEGYTNSMIIFNSYPEQVNQYENILINFRARTPNQVSTEVEISLNSKVVKTVNADMAVQVLTLMLTEKGQNTITFKAGGTTRTITVNVVESSFSVEIEDNGLELYLSAKNRSNSDANKEEWIYNAYSCKLNNFNFRNNGWMLDEKGISILKLNSGASVEIPFSLFKNDIRGTGKTIEIDFSTKNVSDVTGSLISCMQNAIGINITANNIAFSSAQKTLSYFFKDAERVRVAIVIQKSSSDRLMSIYLNGILSSVYQYTQQDSFLHQNSVPITLGCEYAELNIYNIRIYNTDLKQGQILNNFMADCGNASDILAVYERNNILNSDGYVDYNTVADKIPVMTFIGRLPSYKGDKTKNSIIYEDRINPENSFTANNVGNDVQGTSSQYYPRKNYKIKFDKTLGITMTQTLENKKKYPLRANSLPVDCFCLKADFAESSSTHNTGLAKIMHDLMISLDILTPPQRKLKNAGEPINVRTTVDGFPILVFHKETESSEPKFLGKYNFNNDKSTFDTFGFTSEYPKCESIEFLNNNSERVTFNVSDFDTMITDDLGNSYSAWIEDFEFRYPDDDTLNEEYANGTRKPEQYKRLTDWILSTKNNKEKFRLEAPQYFDMDGLIFYYVMTEFFAMVDQRAKNQFATTWDGLKWWFIFYDNDTTLGLDNNGIIVFHPEIEYHDTVGGVPAWNDKASSVLWTNVETEFKNEISAMYKKVRGVLDFKKIIDYMNTEQSNKWAETIYNEDALFKYVEPLTIGVHDPVTDTWTKTGTYLERAQGSRSEHRRWWVYNRVLYMDSKYNTGTHASDYVRMRVYTPTGSQAITPNGDFTITPTSDQYLTVKYENSEVRAKGIKNTPTLIKKPDGLNLTDTNVIIYGASKIKDLGDLASKYINYLDLGDASSIINLKIGDSKAGYKNELLKELTLGNNPMLKNVDIRNCTELAGTVDFSGCHNIESIYASGTKITMLNIAEGSNLKILHLPETITNLTLLGLKNLQTLSYTSLANIQTLNIDCGNVDDLFLKVIRGSFSLTALRVVGLKGVARILQEELYNLLDKFGINELGQNTPKPVLKGTLNIEHYSDMTVAEKNRIQSLFPELTINWILVEAVGKLKNLFPDLILAEYIRLKTGKLSTDWYLKQSDLDSITYLGIDADSYWWANESWFYNKTVNSWQGIELLTNIKNCYLKGVLGTADYIDLSKATKLKNLYYAFTNNKVLKTVKLPEIMDELINSPYTFAGCSALTSVNIPKSMNKVTDLSAFFEECQNLETDFTLPENMPELTSVASIFYRVYKAKKITFPKYAPKLKSITGACKQISNLTEVTLPLSMPSLESAVDFFQYTGTNVPQLLINMPAKLPDSLTTTLSATGFDQADNYLIKYHADPTVTSKSQIKFHNASGVSQYTKATLDYSNLTNVPLVYSRMALNEEEVPQELQEVEYETLEVNGVELHPATVEKIKSGNFRLPTEGKYIFEPKGENIKQRVQYKCLYSKTASEVVEEITEEDIVQLM